MTTTFSAHIAAIAQRLQNLADLKDGWDTYDGSAPSSEALETLTSVVLQIIGSTGQDARLQSLHVGPVPGGAVIEWPVGSRALEIYIDPEGNARGLRVEMVKDEVDRGPLEIGEILDEVRWLLEGRKTG